MILSAENNGRSDFYQSLQNKSLVTVSIIPTTRNFSILLLIIFNIRNENLNYFNLITPKLCISINIKLESYRYRHLHLMWKKGKPNKSCKKIINCIQLVKTTEKLYEFSVLIQQKTQTLSCWTLFRNSVK